MARLPRSLWLLAFAAIVSAAAVGIALTIAPDALAAQVAGRWGQALGEGAGAIACALCAHGLSGHARRAWGLFAIGEAIWALTDLAAGVGLLVGLDPSPPSVFDIAWLSFYVPMLGGVLLLYRRMRPERSWRGALDAALVSAAVSLFGWVVLLQPIAAEGRGGSLGTLVNLLYPIFDLACLGALGWLVVRHARAAPAWLWWVLAAFGLGLTADVAYLLTYVSGLPTAAGVAAAAYTLAGWLWAIAATRRMAWTEPAGDAVAPSSPPAWSEAVPLACGLSVVALVAVDEGLLGLLVVGVLGIALARMTMTTRANRGLTADRVLQEERLRVLLSEQAALRRVAEAVANEMAPGGLFALVAREVAGLFRADCGLVWRFEGESAEAVGSFGDDHTRAGHRIELTGTGAAPMVARTSASTRSSYALAGAAESGLWRHGIASPVVVAGRLWGCVHIAVTRPDDHTPFDEASGDRLECFADLVGLALANAEARIALEARAATDPLTGLANHRFFQERLRDEWDRARRHGHDLSLAIIDLDHFKRVNDLLGHPAGDGVLVELARRLRQATRSHDILARVGGEEFAWVLPHASESEAMGAAERARALICAEPFPGVGTLTASFGVCHAGYASGPTELHQMADESLYAAKRRGRDQVRGYPVRDLPVAPQHADGIDRPEAQTVAGIIGLARAVDAKDPATRRHSGRVADLAVQLATALGWDANRCIALRDAGLMHDVGKIAVPDAILLKPGRLTAQEYEIVKTHAAVGAAIVADVFSPEQVAWVRHHHERMDGAGYPDALAGDEIPEGARILAVADSVDVMISPRAYSPSVDIAEAVAECRRCEGTQFDPRVVDALARLAEVGAITPAPAELTPA